MRSLLFPRRDADNDDDVAIGVTQIVAFQIVLIFTAVAAILALTCRLRVFINHETTFKVRFSKISPQPL